ncbi:MAG: hypothetical protein GXO55_04450 [Chloroflexi bacterium]|nr:hypothetical protein [Chloroflexota bacterium]
MGAVRVVFLLLGMYFAGMASALFVITLKAVASLDDGGSGEARIGFFFTAAVMALSIYCLYIYFFG